MLVDDHEVVRTDFRMLLASQYFIRDIVDIERALDAGAKGYVSKNSAAEVLAKAVAFIADGKRYVEQGLLPEQENISLHEVENLNHTLALYHHVNLMYFAFYQRV